MLRSLGRCASVRWKSATNFGPVAQALSASVDREPKSSTEPASVDFGFRWVSEDEKSKLVGDVFRSVASKYDLMNDLMTAGLHRLWKDHLVSKLNVFSGMSHLDVAGGTGDVAFRVLDALRAIESDDKSGISTGSPKGSVTVFDISEEMVQLGKKRAKARGYENDSAQGQLNWMVGDAEKLPFEESCMDTYTVAFGIRNMTHIDRALAEAYRVLKPGGRFLCLEFSKVDDGVLRRLYDAYSFNVIPALGKFVTGDGESYRYLVESIRRFAGPSELQGMIESAGFRCCGREKLTGGIVAIHSGFKLQDGEKGHEQSHL